MEYKNQILTEISKNLDISPSDFKRAQERFSAVKNWIEKGEYESGFYPDVYLQGSFRLGTVVRPYFGDKEGEFDIDQVCEITVPKGNNSSKVLKHDIGDRLKDNLTYKDMLDEEGKRCWTIVYASQDNTPGFHIDVLPAIPSQNGYKSQIDITDKSASQYTWSVSNPKGYYYWFKSKNVYPAGFLEKQKSEIYQSNRNLYNNEFDVPKQLIRTPLQRSIQIMKRHRDIFFHEKEFKPISIIITTIAASVKSEIDIFGIISDFCNYVISRQDELIRNGFLKKDKTLDYDGHWEIPNPVDLQNNALNTENFADRWNILTELPQAFFEWAHQLKRDLNNFHISNSSEDLYLRIKSVGSDKTYPMLSKGKPLNLIDTNELLKLIHLAIEEKLEWDFVNSVSQKILNEADSEYSLDVSKINHYQIALHKGLRLSNEAIEDINSIFSRNMGSPEFEMCCHLLLGTVTREMISSTVQKYEVGDVLRWPIMKLAPRNFL